MHFFPSDRSKFQFAFELETNLVMSSEAKAHIVVFSPEEKESSIRIVLKDIEENIVREITKTVKLSKNFNHFRELIDLGETTATYKLDIIIDDKSHNNYEFYRLNPKDPEELHEKIISFENSAKSTIALSSIYGLQFRSNQLKSLIEAFETNQSASPIKNLFDEIQNFVKIYEENGHYFTNAGYYLAGFKSKDDQSIQPYSLVLPKNFSIDQEYVMLVCLHGSGVDEVGFVSFMGKNFGELGLPFIVVGPRGRGLSDYYIGQTEKDVFEMVEQMKSMFKIGKSLIFGFSMGGYGVWRLTFLYPNSFDRAIIGSGAPYNDRTEDPAHDIRDLRHNAKHIHYFVMHGTEDRAVPFGPTKEFMEVLVKEGFNVTFKVFEGAGHGNYDPGESLMKWLQQHL